MRYDHNCSEMRMNFFSFVSILFILFLTSCSSNEKRDWGEPVNYLNGRWLAQRVDRVQASGEILSGREYRPEAWLDAVVPGTVLTTLLYNKLIPDPFFSQNNEQIPDIYDVGVGFYTYWFYTKFQLPKEEQGRRIWLKLRGINYRADVYLNGHKINRTTLEGMFKRFGLDITEYVTFSDSNVLAIIVFPPDPPGNAARGQGGDGIIGKNVTMQFTAGWDWIQPIRDRNTGIWDKVSVTSIGPALIADPYITTEVPGIRLPDQNQSPAFITVSTEVKNASDQSWLGILKYACNNRTYKKRIQLAPGESQTVVFDRQKIKDPRLWWPNGSGRPELYDISILASDRSGNLSDHKKLRIGLRDFDSYFDTESGGRVFTVNGQKLFIRGGNWIASDAYLRLSPDRYRAEVKKHAEMNLNMIRIWGGSISERPEFYDACDEYGIMVWQDFWITGDCNGAWNDRLKKDDREIRRLYPDDHDLFLESAEDNIKMLRNHPSLCFWSGGNEYPPPDDIDSALRDDLLPRFDRDRQYFSYSTAKELSVISTGRIVDGPYSLQDPLSFFTRRFPPFNSEIGSVGVPVYESLTQMMTKEELENFPRGREVGESWRYHKYLRYVANEIDYIGLYGQPESAQEFARYAQLVNYDQYRSMLEGWNAHMWEWYTGLLIWKTQNPWTSLRGQMYDPFQEQNGGFFGVQKAAEPIHIQLNLDDFSVAAVNHTFKDLFDCSATVKMYDISGNTIGSEEMGPVTLQPSSSSKLKNLTIPQNFSGVYFVEMILYDSHSVPLSENFYWLRAQAENLFSLHDLEEAILEASLSTHRKEADFEVEMTLKNTSEIVSFWNRLQVVDVETGERILPVSYSDNYFAIVPGGKKTIRLNFSDKKNSETLAEIRLTGWNVPPKNWRINNLQN